MSQEKATVLVVDDENTNLRLMETMLASRGYRVLLAREGEEALEKAALDGPDVILLDIMMPGLSGFDVARRLRESEETKGVPIVMVTALRDVESRVKALEAGADDFLTKPVDKVELEARVRSLLKVKAYNEHMVEHQRKLEEEVAARTRQLEAALGRIRAISLETVISLSRAAEYKDMRTGQHVKRMSEYAAALARHLGMTERAVRNIVYAAPMHDIGKLGIPDRILLKPGTLDPDEWEVMKKHTLIGAEILKGSRFGSIKLGEIIALTHHERYGGTGYVNHLQGEKIPLPGRIVAVADVFDALISERPYKEPIPQDIAFSIIREGRGHQFDPRVVDAFFDIEEEIIGIKEKFSDGNGSP